MSAEQERGEAESFWEQLYIGRAPPTELRASPMLMAFATALPAGTALDLGCARGDDALWLAGRGWAVTAVDVAPSALAVASQRARDAGVSIDFAFPRAAVLAQAAAAVRMGGHLLIVEHASHPPWSWESAGAVFPPPHELLEAMAIETSAWTQLFVGRREREARGPGRQVAVVADNVAFLSRT